MIPLAHNPSLAGDALLTPVAWIAADFHTTRIADFLLLAEKFLKELSHSGDVEICSKTLTPSPLHEFPGDWPEMGSFSDR